MVETKLVDLASLDTAAACDKGAEIELNHPVTGAPLGIFVTVVGKDSDTFKDYIRNSINEKLRKEALAKKRGKDAEITTFEAAEAETIDLLTICTLGWRNMVMNGKELEFNVPNARTVYGKYAWIRKQVDEGISSLENFMQA
jgi:hypothetical protein